MAAIYTALALALTGCSALPGGDVSGQGIRDAAEQSSVSDEGRSENQSPVEDQDGSSAQSPATGENDSSAQSRVTGENGSTAKSAAEQAVSAQGATIAGVDSWEPIPESGKGSRQDVADGIADGMADGVELTTGGDGFTNGKDGKSASAGAGKNGKGGTTGADASTDDTSDNSTAGRETDGRKDHDGNADGPEIDSSSAAGTSSSAEGTSSGDADTASSGEQGAEAGGKITVDTSLVKSSSEELKGLMNAFMQDYGLTAANFAVAYENLSTGETYYFNELKQWDAASTYKFPLNLLYYDKQAAGEITGDTIIPGTNTPLSECHHQSLEFSNNPLSEAMMDNLGSYDVVKQNMRKYFTLTDAETDNSYYHHNYFCARQMMDCAKYLYDHQSQYREALGYLEAAQPGLYFKRNIPDVTIAQKYGQRDGYEHTAGVVFGNTPFALSVYSYNAGSEPMIGACAKLFYDYTE